MQGMAQNKAKTGGKTQPGKRIRKKAQVSKKTKAKKWEINYSFLQCILFFLLVSCIN